MDENLAFKEALKLADQCSTVKNSILTQKTSIFDMKARIISMQEQILKTTASIEISKDTSKKLELELEEFLNKNNITREDLYG